MTAVKLPIESLVTPIIDLKPYRDPIRFRYSALEDQPTKPTKTTELLKGKRENYKTYKYTINKYPR